MSALAKPNIPRFRRMWPEDVDQVMDIERASYQFPWTPGVFRDCIRVGYFCSVLEINGRVAGYGVMSAGAGEAHILNLCIGEAARGRGFGRSSLNYLLQVAKERRLSRIILEVRPSNTPAVRLYQSAGFEQIGLRRDYYQCPVGREDALVFALEL